MKWINGYTKAMKKFWWHIWHTSEELEFLGSVWKLSEDGYYKKIKRRSIITNIVVYLSPTSSAGNVQSVNFDNINAAISFLRSVKEEQEQEERVENRKLKRMIR